MKPFAAAMPPACAFYLFMYLYLGIYPWTMLLWPYLGQAARRITTTLVNYPFLIKSFKARQLRLLPFRLWPISKRLCQWDATLQR